MRPVVFTNRPDDDEISKTHKQGKHKGSNELDVTGSFSNAKISTYLNVLHDLYPDDLKHIHNWLDIGCGHGEFMTAIKIHSKNTISVKATEPNEEKQASARQHNLDVDFFDLEHHNKRYKANEHYRPFYLPDHLSFASEKIVVDMLKSSGFEILLIKKYPYVKNNLISIIKETAKVFLPNYQSKLKYCLQSKKYAATDMYIRARLKEQ